MKKLPFFPISNFFRLQKKTPETQKSLVVPAGMLLVHLRVTQTVHTFFLTQLSNSVQKNDMSCLNIC